MMTQAQAARHARRILFNFGEPLPTNVEHALRKRVDKQLRSKVLPPGLMLGMGIATLGGVTGTF